jgi:hypothetical protein
MAQRVHLPSVPVPQQNLIEEHQAVGLPLLCLKSNTSEQCNYSIARCEIMSKQKVRAVRSKILCLISAHFLKQGKECASIFGA